MRSTSAVIWSDRERRIGGSAVAASDATRRPSRTTSRRHRRGAAGIGQAAGKGLRWSLVGAFATRFGGLALGMVLARLLTPEDFGLYAIALGAMYFVMHVNDVGLIAATVQWRGRIEEMAPTATTLALAFSIGIYGLFFVFAPAFAGLAGNPEAAPIVRVLTLVMIVDGVTAVRAGYLVRTFQQHRITTAKSVGADRERHGGDIAGRARRRGDELRRRPGHGRGHHRRRSSCGRRTCPGGSASTGQWRGGS